MRKLYTEERRSFILQQLSTNNRASVSDLAKMLNVSDATIRLDLRDLENRSLIQRTHGGAIMPEESDMSFTSRLTQHRKEKEAIAIQALKYIEDHDSLLLDASSTCLELAKLLRKMDMNLTVTTYGLYTAQELVDNPSINVFLIGGALRNQNSVEGLLGVSLLDYVFPEKLFFSARALKQSGELMDFDLYELELKNAMFRKSEKRFCLLDSSKIFSTSVGKFGHLKDSDALITNSGIPEELFDLFPNLNIDVCD